MVNNVDVANKFIPLLETNARYVICMGGRGSSKSTHATIKLLLKSFEPKYNHILYINKEKAHIKAQQYATFKLVAKQIGLYDCFRWYNGDYRIENVITGTIFTPVGMDDPQKTKGISDPTIIFWDEITKGTQEDFTTLNALLRTPKNKHQFIMCFNPISEKHWIRNFFFGDNPYELKDDFADSYLSISTYLDNPFINHSEYRATLELNAGGNLAKLECDLYGRWGNVPKDNLYIFNFIKEKHNRPLEIDLKNHIYISLDFNVSPLCALVCQTNIFNTFIHIIDEIRLETADIYEMAKIIKSRYPTNRLIITGDAAGWSRSVNSRGNKSSYDILIEELRISRSQVKIPKNIKYSGYVQDKRQIANTLLSIHPQFYIGDCPYLIDDIENVQATEDSKMAKNKDHKATHLLDCLCDFLFAHCRDYIKFKGKNK
jgi:PBSX family phage terminase large subunit